MNSKSTDHNNKMKLISDIKAPAEIPHDEAFELVQRLYEMGLRPGIYVEIVTRISFGTVTVVQFGQTRLALNEQEMLCLHGLL